MQAPMQFLSGDHVAQLAVLIGLTRLEGLAIGHAHRRQETGTKTSQIAQIGRRRDGDLAPELFGIGGDRSQDHQTPGGMVGALQVGQQTLNQQKMPQMVGGHRDFVALR